MDRRWAAVGMCWEVERRELGGGEKEMGCEKCGVGA